MHFIELSGEVLGCDGQDNGVEAPAYGCEWLHISAWGVRERVVKVIFAVDAVIAGI